LVLNGSKFGYIRTDYFMINALKMKNVTLLLFVFLVFSCSCNRSKIVIKGKIENSKSSSVYFQEITLKNDGTIDSVQLSKSGTFKYTTNAAYSKFYLVWMKNQKPLTLVVHPGDRIKITAANNNLFYTAQIHNSEDSKRALIINQMLDGAINKLDSLNKVYQQFLTNPNIVQIKQTLSMNYDQVIEEQRAFTYLFIDQDKSSLANFIALYQEIDPRNHIFLLNREEDFKYFDKLDSLLYKKYPTVPHIIALHSKVNDLRTYYQRLKVQRLLDVMGTSAPEIALPSPNGDTIRLSSLKGKYVLLDFWASWCPPCRAENPNLVDMYKKYHRYGFEIYQVSLDKTKDAWLKAIKNDKLEWIHVSDLQFWSSPVAKLYAVESIPASFLIDKDGSIMARNLRGESLEDRLRQIFEK
jgi:peroxiredoxin